MGAMTSANQTYINACEAKARKCVAMSDAAYAAGDRRMAEHWEHIAKLHYAEAAKARAYTVH